MSRIDITRLTQPVSRPPVQSLIDDHGRRVEEEQTYVGWVEASAGQARSLRDHGIDLTLAEHDPEAGRWERCLFSDQVLTLLEDLHAEGDFPYRFEAVPSEGELEWLDRQARGEPDRPVLPLRAYLQPASADAIDAWAARGTAVTRPPTGLEALAQPPSPSEDQPLSLHRPRPIRRPATEQKTRPEKPLRSTKGDDTDT